MVTFLLRDVDRDLWAKVKKYVFSHRQTIREFIIESIQMRFKNESGK